MIPDSPALYLECRYDRAQALRVIVRRLTHELYGQGPVPHPTRQRLKARLTRAQRHLIALTGGSL